MIARNFIQFPEALALQLCLPWGPIVRWALARPGNRALRAIRAARAELAKRHPFVRPDFPPLCEAEARPVPGWVKSAAKVARALAARVKAACRPLDFHSSSGNDETNDDTSTHTTTPHTAEKIRSRITGSTSRIDQPSAWPHLVEALLQAGQRATLALAQAVRAHDEAERTRQIELWTRQTGPEGATH